MLTPIKTAASKQDREKDNKAARLARCGRCANCKSQDCGNCYNCADKPKFGGPGIKKQACVQRKCLLMVPRDEDGEKLARKRAKQRTLPGLDRLAGIAGAPIADAIRSPSSPSPTRSPSFASLPSQGSPRSNTSSPADGIATDPDALGVEAAKAQAMSERALFSLALDDDEEHDRSLTSAMLFAAIQTPNSSPQRAARAATCASDDAEVTAATSASDAELDLADDSAACDPATRATTSREKARAEALSAAFTAHISAKLELDEPPKPPRLDELHEEFLLLNHEHRRDPHESEQRVPPILAF